MLDTKILKRGEVDAVLTYCQTRARGRKQPSKCGWRNLVIFRLAAGCGLRRQEIAGLDLRDFILSGPTPYLRVRKEITKGRVGKKKGRQVPLWWDKGTFHDLKHWYDKRLEMGAGPLDPFVCAVSEGSVGNRLTGPEVAVYWRSCLKCLNPARRLSVHCGRHTFCSHALDVGHSLAAVRDAAGHRNIATTSIYLHAVDERKVPDLYSFNEERPGEYDKSRIDEQTKRIIDYLQRTLGRGGDVGPEERGRDVPESA